MLIKILSSDLIHQISYLNQIKVLYQHFHSEHFKLMYLVNHFEKSIMVLKISKTTMNL